MLAKQGVRTVLASSDFQEPFFRSSIPLSNHGVPLFTIYSTSLGIKLPYHRNLTMLIDLECEEHFAKVRFTYVHQVDVY